VSVLLRQADGFEGFSLVLCLLDAHYESVAQLEDEGVVLASLSTAQSATRLDAYPTTA
jgi:hypothetical protein